MAAPTSGGEGFCVIDLSIGFVGQKGLVRCCDGWMKKPQFPVSQAQASGTIRVHL